MIIAGMLAILVPALVIAQSVTKTQKPKENQNLEEIYQNLEQIGKAEPLPEMPKGEQPKPEPPKPKPQPQVRLSISGEQCVAWIRQAGVAEGEVSSAFRLIMRESGCRVNATNASSGAFGIPQSLPASKMASAGADWRTNPVTQIRWMKGYCEARYGSFAKALAFQLSRGWY